MKFDYNYLSSFILLNLFFFTALDRRLLIDFLNQALFITCIMHLLLFNLILRRQFVIWFIIYLVTLFFCWIFRYIRLRYFVLFLLFFFVLLILNVELTKIFQLAYFYTASIYENIFYRCFYFAISILHHNISQLAG